jgi:putative PIN family toxin of toxin-antitoxin system
MIPVIFDCNVVISAIGWGGNPRSCLNLVAAGQATLYLTPEIWSEYDQRVPAVLSDQRPQVDARPMLDWILRTAIMVEPNALGKRRSRDAKDDRYISCALSANAKFIVTSDRDLLDLEKPFGIKIGTPMDFLRFIRGKSNQ